MHAGCGYMANTTAVSDINVKTVCVHKDRDRLAPADVFYIASKPIKKGGEIFVRYNWKKLSL